MDCKYFGVCGSCNFYQDSYDKQLESKKESIKAEFAPFFDGYIETFGSKNIHFRSRCEFRIFHSDSAISYAMHRADKNGALLIDECNMVDENIYVLMPKLLDALVKFKLEHKLFGVEFLSSSSGEILVTLLYHKHIDNSWLEMAKKLSCGLGVDIIGRSRGVKLVTSKDYITEQLNIDGKVFSYRYIEGSFTQPNRAVNEKMISWALECTKDSKADLLELYCGAGNFSIPLSRNFKRVLATEISKASISAAKENMLLNGVKNIEFLRMNVEDFKGAMDKIRPYNRSKHIDLDSYNIETIFVDPPRSGLDSSSLELASRYKNILYISCNPLTLKRDLETLSKSHKIEKMAIFDQFAYTYHLEMGIKLVRL